VNEIATEFTRNCDRYSVFIKARQENRAAFERLSQKISAAAKELDASQKELNTLIWKAKENE
jgi:hypothetical protein